MRAAAQSAMIVVFTFRSSLLETKEPALRIQRRRDGIVERKNV
jgi:hypothetical protein